jgi:hypothetical protein
MAEALTYANRLSIAIDYAKLKQGEVAERSGVKQQVISGILTRGSEGSVYTAQFARACGVDSYWLATGAGPMLPPNASDLPESALKVARAWSKLPDFKRAGYMQAIITDAAVLEVFPELEAAMRTAAIATDPDYHKATEAFIQSRAKLKRQLELSL